MQAQAELKMIGSPTTPLLAIVVILALLGSFNINVSAQSTENVASIFEIGVGARPLGMGGAFVGLADDENAFFYNPAALGYLTQAGLTSLYSTQFGVMNYGGVGLASRSIGVGVLFLSSTGIQQVGENSELLAPFDYTNIAGIGSFGIPFGPFGIGTRAKYYQVSTLPEGSGNGFAVDAAAMLNLGVLRVGALIENVISQPIQYGSGYEEPWPQKARVGVAIRTGVFNLAADFDLDGILHVGAEFLSGPIGVRAGAWGAVEQFTTPNLSVGVSLKISNVEIVYALLLPPELPDTHRLSLTLLL